MAKKIYEILEEIYQIDPSLRKHSAKLEKLVDFIIGSKPDIKIDDKFVEELKMKLRDQVQKQKLGGAAPTQYNSSNPFKFFVPISIGTAAVALGVFIYINGFTNSSPANQTLESDFNNGEIIALEENAFGPLITRSEVSEPSLPETSSIRPFPSELTSSLDSGQSNLSNEGNNTLTPPNNIPRPEVINPVEEASEGEAFGLGGGAVSTSILPRDYSPTYYSYVYEGDEVDLTESKRNVYRRVNSSLNTSSVINALSGFNFNNFNLNNFSNLNVDYFQLSEDRPNGYTVNLNFTEGSINLNQNWRKWENYFADCDGDYECIESKRLTFNDIPEDSEIIAIADDFLTKYEIDQNNYGEPEVVKYWEREAAMSGVDFTSSRAFIPEVLTVVYPLKINEEEVLSESGYPIGLNVGVNLYFNEVVHMSDLRIEQYQSSEYDAVTDWSSIVDFMKGGANRYAFVDVQNPPDGVEIVEVKVEDPTIVLSEFWLEETQESDPVRLFAPAISFKVIAPEDSERYFQDRITIPLIKEIFEERTKIMEDGPIVRPLPEPIPLPEVTSAVSEPAIELLEDN